MKLDFSPSCKNVARKPRTPLSLLKDLHEQAPCSASGHRELWALECGNNDALLWKPSTSIPFQCRAFNYGGDGRQMRQCHPQVRRGYMHASSCLKKSSHSTSFHVPANKEGPFPFQRWVSVTWCQLFQLPQLENSGGFQTVIRQIRAELKEVKQREGRMLRAHTEKQHAKINCICLWPYWHLS